MRPTFYALLVFLQMPLVMAAELPPPPPEDLTPEEKRDIEAFRRASASVVYITTRAMRRDRFSLDAHELPKGTGSGFIWDTAGHVVTNFHVVQGGDAFEVTLADHTTLPAKLIGAAPNKDLAVLEIKVPADRLNPLERGYSHNLVVGQRALAVGNPFGLDHSLSVGVISALGRELKSPGGRTIHDVIQTDAAINPGNSGGPLLDSHGRLIGVNSAIYSPSGAFAGIGFSIPIDTVSRLVPQLIKNGRPIEPGIGISLLPDSYAARFGIDGAVVYEVPQTSIGGKAGLIGLRRANFGAIEVGDRIVGLNGNRVKGGEALLEAFERMGVGSPVSLTVVRGKTTRELQVALGED